MLRCHSPDRAAGSGRSLPEVGPAGLARWWTPRNPGPRCRPRISLTLNPGYDSTASDVRLSAGQTRCAYQCVIEID